MKNSIELVVAVPAGLAPEAIDQQATLRRAYARGPVHIAQGDADAYWFDYFSVRRRGDWPVARLRAATPAAYTICADPVYLGVSGDAVTLDARAAADLTPDDARTLMAILNRHFAVDGLRVTEVSAQEWLLEGAVAIDATTTPPARAHGFSIENFLPQGPQARLLKRIGNEAQMLLHDTPVNLARQARGQAPINAVWLWGASAQAMQSNESKVMPANGDATTSVKGNSRTPRSLTLYSSAAHVRALARAAGATAMALPESAQLLENRASAGALAFDLDARLFDAQSFLPWLEAHWIEPLRQRAILQRGACRLTLLLGTTRAGVDLFRPDPWRLLRRGGLARRLQRAGAAALAR